MLENKHSPGDSRKNELCQVMRLQLQALLKIASAEDLNALSKHINTDMIDDMQKLCDLSDVETQFIRVCAEISARGLSAKVNAYVADQLRINLSNESF